MSSAATRYQGWPNYATWAVYTQITNDATLNTAMRRRATAAESDIAAADMLRDWLEEGNPLASGPASWYMDLLQWAIEQVNCLELARALRAEGKEGAE